MNTGHLTPGEVADAAAAFLAKQWNDTVTVEQVEKIFGGASRETFRLKLHVGDTTRGVILRRDPPSSLIDTERRLEYGAYRAVYGSKVPVPEPLFLEEDPKWMGRPFSVMEEIVGCDTDVSGLDANGRKRIGTQKWRIMGELAAMDPLSLGFDEFTDVPALDTCAGRELEYWAGVIEQDEIHPQPVARAAIRWLRRNMPPSAQKLSVVHGDFRTGNFLFSPDEGIKGILDWEMCHLGDPLEDLAWSLDPLWNWGMPDLAGRLLPHDEAIAVWEDASGLVCDRTAFRWWRIFAATKAVAIWISSSEDFQVGASKEAVLAYAGWVMTDRENRILLDYLSPESQHEFGELA